MFHKELYDTPDAQRPQHFTNESKHTEDKRKYGSFRLSYLLLVLY